MTGYEYIKKYRNIANVDGDEHWERLMLDPKDGSLHLVHAHESHGGHGRGADADWFRTGRGRGLATDTANWPGDYADIPHPNRDHFVDAKTFAGEGVRLVCEIKMRFQ